MGKAPLPKKSFERENVCPECYIQLWQKCEYMTTSEFVVAVDNGTRFPPSMIGRTAEGETQILYGVRAKDPKKLFKAPTNYHLKKKDVKALAEDPGLVYGKVFMR